MKVFCLGFPIKNMYPPGNGYISHLGKFKIIFKIDFSGDMLVPRRVIIVEKVTGILGGGQTQGICQNFKNYTITIVGGFNPFEKY